MGLGSSAWSTWGRGPGRKGRLSPRSPQKRLQGVKWCREDTAKSGVEALAGLQVDCRVSSQTGPLGLWASGHINSEGPA